MRARVPFAGVVSHEVACYVVQATCMPTLVEGTFIGVLARWMRDLADLLYLPKAETILRTRSAAATQSRTVPWPQ